MADAAEALPHSRLYQTDFYRWTQEQARLLRGGRWRDLDLENLVEEVESVGRSNKQEIRNRLTVLLEHLLKWEFQPDKRKYGWRATLSEQRGAIEAVIEDSPSLHDQPALVLDKAYGLARLRAAQDMDVSERTFPASCPYSVEQALDFGFYPGRPETEIV